MWLSYCVGSEVYYWVAFAVTIFFAIVPGKIERLADFKNRILNFYYLKGGTSNRERIKKTITYIDETPVASLDKTVISPILTIF